MKKRYCVKCFKQVSINVTQVTKEYSVIFETCECGHEKTYFKKKVSYLI